MTTNGNVSFWYAATGVPQPRAALPGSTEVDVCIVGAGFTGLWTAYYLKLAEPSLRIAVVEQRFAGYGASGRNGGWLFGGIAGSRTRYAKSHGRQSVIDLQEAMNASVGEVVRVTESEGIDADVVKGGVLEVAYSPPQLERLKEFVAGEHGWGETDHELLSADESNARIAVANTLGGAFSPHGARVHPAKLVRGLAEAVERLGVDIYEDTRVIEISPKRAVTPHGVVNADYIVRATEGFTAGIKGLRRQWLPMNSSMIVTEPLSDEVWSSIGWNGCETLGDMAHAYCYAQRTADGRIAIGGRGVPYRYGSKTDNDGTTQPETVSALREILVRLFPATRDVAIDHAWSGVLGVPRDWCSTVGLDRQTGLAWAGGYVGHGVATTNLAGRTLTDLLLSRESELTRLPWVGRRVRKWEPEPLRWLGVQTMYAAYRTADRQERDGRSKTSPIARVADKISGRT
ncbi:MAG TPA: FAD-dependent oxidoreductase [Actinomycetes bacterium]|nr:FAD-dependent oxidoreductase [Actinomycetes bacterium]